MQCKNKQKKTLQALQPQQKSTSSRQQQQRQQQQQQSSADDNKQEEEKEEQDQKEKTSSEEQDEEEEKKKAQKELRQTCWDHAALSYSKTAALVQHIVPIQPSHAPKGPEPQPVLRLTKKELKRQRKLRRQTKQQELQDLQAAGLVEAPQPKLTLQNFMQVMGDAAYMDPSLMERKVQEQVQARQRAHHERNQAKKLTPAERTAKRVKKLVQDTEHATKHGSVGVAIFYLRDASHPYHRTKMDLNAQQMKITGVVLECQVPTMACVFCEGGPKALKKYKRLMTDRMRWEGLDDDDDDDDEDVIPQQQPSADGVEGMTNIDDPDAPPAKQPFNRNNHCNLIWEGMSTQRIFTAFSFQLCETADQARQVLESKGGVGHYWDQVLQYHHLQVRRGGGTGGLGLKLASKNQDNDDDDDVKMEVKEEEDENPESMEVDEDNGD